MKSESTSFDVAAVVYELDKTVIGSRVENIYQINPLTLVFRLHQPNQPALQLLIESGRRVHLTTYVLSKPTTPPAFSMALRKHLRNGRITLVQQHEFERVINIRIDTREGAFTLITELFGDGDIILVNPHGAILYALTYRKMRDRNILRGEEFKQAPSSGKNPFELTRQDLNSLKECGRLEVVRALTKLLSIGGFYTEEILLRADVDKNTQCEMLTKQQLDAIFAQTQSLTSGIAAGAFQPGIVVDKNDQWIDVIPFALKVYSDLTLKPFRSFNEALDEYYSRIVTTEKVSGAEKEFTRELAKLQRTLEDQQKTVGSSAKIIERSKAIGNLIYVHLSDLQSLVQTIVQKKELGETWEQIIDDVEKEKHAQHSPFTYVRSLDSKRRILEVSIENSAFTLDLARSVQANAASYYVRAKKTERKQEGAEKALNETRAKIQELQKRMLEKTEEVVKEAPLKKKVNEWFEKFRWFRSSEGLLVIGGRDATTNEIIIKKQTEPKDIVFHADIIGAPFVVIKTEGRTPSEQTILEAAQFAASHSKAWRGLFNAVDVYWVYPDQLSKSPPPGQYLEKGSFIVHGKKNYLKRTLLSIAVGIAMKEDQVLVIGGPTEYVKKQTTNYVEVVPGHESSSALAKNLRKILSEKAPAEWQRKILAVPLEEIQKFIPSGRGAVAVQP